MTFSDDIFSHDDQQPAIDPQVLQRLNDIVSRLRDAASSLDDVMFDVLREASRRREGRPPIDKTLSQARRAIDKAVHLLNVD
jgi:ABC-type transporter Mla subunit MlaD